jgi:hypothetical protein
MFSNLTVGIILGIGFGGWVYAKMQRKTGGNTKSSLIVAGACGLVALLFAVIILGMLFKES